jgi:hypothetical protein
MSPHARVFPNAGFKTIPFDKTVEEEALPGYDAQKYYPVRLGEVFRSRCQAVAKLEYGGRSTVWLCLDLKHVDDP